MKIQLYNRKQEKAYTIPVGSGSTYTWKKQEEEYITVKFSSVTVLALKKGFYTEVEDLGRFEVVDLTAPTKSSRNAGYDYELRLDRPWYRFKNRIIFFRRGSVSGMESKWSLTDTLAAHAGVLTDNLASTGCTCGGQDYVVYIHDDVEKRNEAKLIAYDSTTLLSAIDKMAEEFDTEWWIEGNIINFGRCEQGDKYISLEQGRELNGLSRSEDSEVHGTRLYAFGSTRNLNQNYRRELKNPFTIDGFHIVENRQIFSFKDLQLPKKAITKNSTITLEDGTTVGIEYIGIVSDYGTTVNDGRECYGLSEKTWRLAGSKQKVTLAHLAMAYVSKLYTEPVDGQGDVAIQGVADTVLQLPIGTPYIDSAPDLDPSDITDIVKTYEDIYPRALLTITEVTEVQAKTTDTDTGDVTYWTAYRFKAKLQDGSPFVFDSIYETQDDSKPLSIHFESGKLNGMDFEVHFNPDADVDDNQLFEITRNDTYTLELPNETMKPEVGDTLYMYNMDITFIDDALVEAAENELLAEARKDMEKMKVDSGTYTGTKNPVLFGKDRISLTYGSKVRLVAPEYFTAEEDHARESRIIGWELDLEDLTQGELTIGESTHTSNSESLAETVSEIVYMNDQIQTQQELQTTKIKSLIETIAGKKYLSKLSDDTAQGVITFLQGLKVGNTGNSEITAEGLARLYAYMTYGFNSGLYGTGASIDHKGNAELNSLFVRQFISTPKFVFNEIAVTKAEQWNTNGYGTIESVDLENQQITLKLEENDYGSLSEGDICRGIFADIDNAYGSDSVTEGETDESGFVMHKGFFTTYFYVKRIITSEKGKFVFEYGKKSPSTPDPCAYMDFAQYGSFTDDKRRSSMYFSSRGNSYIEVLEGVNTWDVKTQNRVCRYGYLGGLSLQDKDGKPVYPKGNGIYVQDNVYFGGTIHYLQGLSGLEELENLQSAYDVSLSQYQSVLTVDDMGNVIGGLYTEDEAQTTKQYKVTTAVFVRKGLDILLEEDDANEDVTEGHYRLHAVSNECSVKIENSTVFVTAIENIKDGVAGSADDASFDYDRMRKMTDCMVTLVVDLEGKTSKTIQMPIRIQHDSLPFMVCDLSNEHASVAWNTRTSSYTGFPIETKVSLYYQNTPYDISDINITVPTGLKASMNISGKAKTITVETDGITGDSLPSVIKLPITVVGKYAGASYEYTKELTVAKSADTVVYEVVPSADSISVDKDGNLSQGSVSCRVYATSSDDKRYEITSLPSGFSLKYAYGDTPSTAVAMGASVAVSADVGMVTFGLYDASGNVLDKESVPVVKDGKYAPKASSDDDIITVPTDSDGNALDAFSETVTLSLMVDGKACTVSSVEVTKNGLTNATCTVSGSKAVIACAKGAALGKAGQTLVLKVVGTKNDTEYADYVTLKLVPNVTGEDGDGYEYVYYRSSSSSAPSAPKRSGGSLTSGWYDDPMSPTDSYQYVYVAYKTGEVGSDGTFSTPILFNRYPKSIDYETTKYYTNSSGTSAPSASTIWSSGTTYMPSDFNDKYPWLWKLTRTFYTDGSSSDSVVCIGYKAKDGADGADGKDGTDGKDGSSGARGPIPRTHTGITKNDYYMSGADGEAYVDLVYYNNAWYRCTSSHTATSTTMDTTKWEQSQTTGWTFMATDLLLAETGYIENLRVDDVYITSKGSGEGDTIFIANKNGLTCKSGTFENVTVSGKVTATSGKIGDFTITSTSLTTTISGALTTTSGGLFQNGSFWVRHKPYVEVCMGKAADYDLTDSNNSQKACDMYGSRADSNATENTMIVRKYTKSTNIGSSVSMQAKPSDPAYAALNVDTDENPGIRSIGGNLFGSIAQSVIKTSYLTSSDYTAINNNRVGVVVMTNGAEQSVTLPTSPMVGQMFTVIRQGAGNVRVYSGSKIITDVGNGSGVTSVLVETYNNWARFLWDGSAWCYERSYYS